MTVCNRGNLSGSAAAGGLVAHFDAEQSIFRDLGPAWIGLEAYRA